MVKEGAYSIERLQKRINYKFTSEALLEEALTHPSMTRSQSSKDYERLEMLGDKVLGLAIADMLFRENRALDEGMLSIMHSNLINTEFVSNIAMGIELGEFMRFDIGEKKNNGGNNRRNLENCLEAIIGAVYMDSSFGEALRVVSEMWKPYIHSSDNLHLRDPKSKLQEWAQYHGKDIPVYMVVKEEGTAHAPLFTVRVLVEGEGEAYASASSKKQAQKNAAQNMLELLEGREGDSSVK